jgi:hypothetical protein
MSANDSKLDVISFTGNFRSISSKDFGPLNIFKENDGYSRSNVSMNKLYLVNDDHIALKNLRNSLEGVLINLTN